MSATLVRSIGWSVVAATAALVVAGGARAQDAGSAPSAINLPPPVETTAEQDHQKMMEQLHITALRPGADGMNPKAANYQNTDESKANVYPNLPDPLTLKNGKKVTNAKTWWKQRRPEIVEDFDREIYGRVPKVTPKVRWEVTSTTEEASFNTEAVSPINNGKENRSKKSASTAMTFFS